MKKSTIWSIVVVAVLALGGAGAYFYSSQQKQSQEQTASSSYSSHMQAGKEAVKAKKYSQAADEFDQAYQAKATAQAKNYQAQAENLADSVKLAKTTVKYDSALNLAQKAQEQNGGYSVMTSQAKKLVKQLKAVKDNYDSEIKPLLNKAAKAMEDGDYTPELAAALKERLATVFNRGFWEGYYAGRPIVEHSRHHGSAATKRKVYVGKVTNFFKKISTGLLSF